MLEFRKQAPGQISNTTLLKIWLRPENLHVLLLEALCVFAPEGHGFPQPGTGKTYLKIEFLDNSSIESTVDSTHRLHRHI